ncbi:MAG: hypothetical protein ACRD2E_08905 [Terriglobales bacterium]
MDTDFVDVAEPIAADELPLDDAGVQDAAGPSPIETAAPLPAQAASEAPIPNGDVVKWLREQSKAMPEHDRLFSKLRDSYFSAQEYSNLFPEIDSARTIKTHLDAIGGLDGLNDLQSISNDMNELYSAIDSGDPGVIDDIAQNSRDGFLKLVPHALDVLYRTDPAAYNSVLTPIVANTLLQSPIADSIALAIDRLQRGEGDAAIRELGRVQSIFENLRQQAAAPRSPAYGGAAPQGQPQGGSAQSPMIAQIQPVIEQYVDRTSRADIQAGIGARKLTDPAMGRVLVLVQNELGATLGADQNYQNRLQALFRSGNAERTRQFIQANVDQVRPRIVRQIVGEMYGQPQAAATARRPPGQAQAVGQQRAPIGDGVHQLSRPPLDKDIDWSLTDTTAMIAHRAMLKDGRKVSWPHK